MREGGGSLLSKDKPQKEQIKVTDKRIFTPEGDIREEFRTDIRPADPGAEAPPRPPAPEPPPPRPAEKPKQPERRAKDEGLPPGGERRSKTIADTAESPGTPFVMFVEPLIVQAYVNLGMLRNPYQPQTKIDPGAARLMIDILTLLQEKTAGNLTEDEEDFLHTHLSELKLAYVQRTKSVG